MTTRDALSAPACGAVHERVHERGREGGEECSEWMRSVLG